MDRIEGRFANSFSRRHCGSQERRHGRQERVGELSEEGMRHYKLIALKTKMHNGLSDLGARVFSLVTAEGWENPSEDAKVKDITTQLKRYEAEIFLLEKKFRKSSKRKTGRAA